jgi:hypothetical protein
MKPLSHLIVDLVVVLLREAIFTKKRLAQAFDMNQGLVQQHKRSTQGGRGCNDETNGLHDNQCNIVSWH